MTKLYTVASVDEKIDEAFVVLRTLDELKARELCDHLHSVSEDYRDIKVIEDELDEPVYLIDVKFKGSAGKMDNVVEIGDPEADEALNGATIYRKQQIA